LTSGTGSAAPRGESNLFNHWTEDGITAAPLYLQSHWGSQVTYKNTQIDAWYGPWSEVQ
jgi:hypothetical protein